VTSGFLPSTEGEIALGSDRIDALRELVEEYPVREPLVILCRYHFELRAVDSLMGRLGRSKAVISGKIPQTERDRIKHAFQDGEVDTVVAQVRSVGIAIDLSRSRTAIFYSTPQSLIDYDQAKARVIARTGGSVSIIHLVARGTVDEEVVENSKTRGDLVSKVLSKINSNSK
jgi:superfamily II DNA/RNA helicase